MDGTLTMNRTGQFIVTTSGDNHCGVNSPLPINYHLVCKCDASSLDSRGFLFDQLNVQAFFDRLRHVTVSCEALCINCTEEIRRMIERENPHCAIISMALTLSPAPHAASMTHEWQREERQERKPKRDRAAYMRDYRAKQPKCRSECNG